MKLKRSGAFYYQILDGETLVCGASQLNNDKWIAVDTDGKRIKGSPIMNKPVDVKKWVEGMMK